MFSINEQSTLLFWCSTSKSHLSFEVMEGGEEDDQGENG